MKQKSFQSKPSKMREARFFKGLSLDALSILTGIHQSYLSRIERSVCWASPEQARLIANALKSTVEEIFPEIHGKAS
jgi:transcriptional regulator with XRE-family HTH domain